MSWQVGRCLATERRIRRVNYYGFEGLVVDPCAVQEHLPVWIGGRTLRSLRRATALADGWCPFAVSPGQARHGLAKVGLPPNFDVVLPPTADLDPIDEPGRTQEILAETEAAGATIVTVGGPRPSSPRVICGDRPAPSMLLGDMSPELYRRTALPTRTDLRTRRERVAAAAAVHAYGLYARLKSRALADVTLPDDDPFYSVPGNLEASGPGEVLDARPVEVRALRRVIDADAWQVKFRSTDVEGAMSWGVATVVIPRRHVEAPARPLLSYQCAIDALGATADPSYTLRHGDQLELRLIALALRRGWAVVTTDYNGPQHAFGTYPLVAHFVLDGIRAAIGLGPAGFDAGTPVGLWGYSGGALATLAAAERQAAYAPGLNIVGAAAGGAGVDITSSPQMFEDGNLLSGIPFAAVIGAGRGFPDVDLQAVLTPQGKAMVAAAAEMNMEQLVASFPFVRWSDHLTVPSVFEVPGMRAAFEQGRPGQATPMTPLHLYHAVHDKYPAITDVDRLVETYRRQGVDVTYRRYRLGGHMTVALTGVPRSLRFLRERFAAARSQ